MVKIPPIGELTAAKTKTVPDILTYGLKILFVGINPGLFTAWSGHHFARPGNRFWKALYLSGFTDQLYTPEAESEILKYRLGITNLVTRATKSATDLTAAEYVTGGQILTEKVKLYKPLCVCFLGMDAYRKAYGYKHVRIGLQRNKIMSSYVWLLPSPSGLNANYKPDDFKKLFLELKKYISGIK